MARLGPGAPLLQGPPSCCCWFHQLEMHHCLPVLLLLGTRLRKSKFITYMFSVSSIDETWLHREGANTP